MMKSHLAVLAAAGLLLSACASDTTRPDSTAGSGTSGTTAPAGDTGRPTAVGTSAPRPGMPGTRVIYFEFDSSELTSDGLAAVGEWAKYLAANSGTRLRLEGHCDERGTREYNVGLGERRANAVRQALGARGVSSNQLSVVSYGEERPVAMGHDEAAWRQNRRVELAQ